jgi:hypothetical protein
LDCQEDAEFPNPVKPLTFSSKSVNLIYKSGFFWFIKNQQFLGGRNGEKIKDNCYSGAANNEVIGSN